MIAVVHSVLVVYGNVYFPFVSAERARPYLMTTEQGDNATDFINAVYVDVSLRKLWWC